MIAYLYRATSPSGKAYVGITTQGVAKRRKKHASVAVGPSPETRGCPALSCAIKKYGASAFKVETPVIADWDYVKDLEPKLITLYGTKVPNGYNISDGGDGTPGVALTVRTRQKMSDVRTGTKLSEEHKKAISDGCRWKGKKRPEHAAKMSVKMKEVWASRNKEQVKEISSNISKAKKGKSIKRRRGGN